MLGALRCKVLGAFGSKVLGDALQSTLARQRQHPTAIALSTLQRSLQAPYSDRLPARLTVCRRRATIGVFVRALNVALFAPYDLARPGGVNTQLRAQARALRRLGHTVRIYGPASAALGQDEVALSGSVDVTFGGTEAGLGLDPRAGSRVAALFDRERFDVVHVHEPLVPLLPWFALRHARAPIAATFHVHREDGHRWYPLARPWLRSLVARVAVRIAVSPAAQRTVAAHFPGDYEIVPNAVDVEAFRVPRVRPRAMTADRPRVLCVGRLEPRKGVDCLIRAMIDVQRRVPAAQLVIVGDGPSRGALADLARTAGVDAQFVGRVGDDVLPAYFQASDVVCAPAIGGESFGVVLIEAMACGKPIVASRIEGYEAIIATTDAGLLAAPGDARALATAIVTLLSDADLRRTFGARGCEASRAYDAASIARQLDAVYQRLVPSPVAAAT